MAVPATGRTDSDQNDGPKALWVANGGGPNVLEFSSFQFDRNGVVSSKPHRVNSSGVFVNPQDTTFDRDGNLWVVDGGNGINTGDSNR